MGLQLLLAEVLLLLFYIVACGFGQMLVMLCLIFSCEQNNNPSSTDSKWRTLGFLWTSHVFQETHSFFGDIQVGPVG